MNVHASMSWYINESWHINHFNTTFFAFLYKQYKLLLVDMFIVERWNTADCRFILNADFTLKSCPKASHLVLSKKAAQELLGSHLIGAPTSRRNRPTQWKKWFKLWQYPTSQSDSAGWYSRNTTFNYRESVSEQVSINSCHMASVGSIAVKVSGGYERQISS